MNTYTKKNPKSTRPQDNATGHGIRLAPVLWLCLAVFYILALWSYSPVDNNILTNGTPGTPGNWLGDTGAWTAMLSFYIFGLASWVMAFVFLTAAITSFFPKKPPLLPSAGGMFLILTASTILFGLQPETFANAAEKLGIGNSTSPALSLSGGVIGQALAAPAVEGIRIFTGGSNTAVTADLPPGFLRQWLGAVGMTIAAWGMLIAGAVVLYFCQWKKIINFASISFRLDSVLDNLRDEDAAAEQQNLLASRLRTKEEHRKAEKPASDSGNDADITADMPARRLNFISRLLASQKNNADVPETPSSPDSLEQPDAAEIRQSAAPAPTPAAAAIPPEPQNIAPPAEEQEQESAQADLTANPQFNRVPDAPDIPQDNGGRAPVRIVTRDYARPNTGMLSSGKEAAPEDSAAINDAKIRIQNTLDDFGVNGSVTGHITGPQVTRFEITLAPGVSVSKVTKLEADLMRSLCADNIRILAPIPGRDVVGVEVPNTKRETVVIRSIFESREWIDSKAEIPVVLGKNISGKPIVSDLAKAPHLLIAGATGSGKSVCVSSILMSLFFKFIPGELSLILIDPKVVEFAFYQDLPFLKTPVINEPSKALLALRWAVDEMEKRYRLLAKAGTRKISEYNSRPIPREPQYDDCGEQLPDKIELLIIVVDEFADLMMAGRDVRKDAETAIARLAQKGRAAGVHIILATQRPSADVITGVIKANLPTKIALRVGNMTDSRVIVDAGGAQNLLGYGDMLFRPPSSPTLERIQGTFLSDGDISKVVNFISAQAKPQFDLSVTSEPDENEEAEVFSGRKDHPSRSGRDAQDDLDVDDLPEETDGIRRLVMKYLKPEDDSLFRQALEIAISERAISTSYLQRRLGIGYNRAANLIDEFERRNIVGPARDGGNKREILVFDEIIGEN